MWKELYHHSIAQKKFLREFLKMHVQIIRQNVLFYAPLFIALVFPRILLYVNDLLHPLKLKRVGCIFFSFCKKSSFFYKTAHRDFVWKMDWHPIMCKKLSNLKLWQSARRTMASLLQYCLQKIKTVSQKTVKSPNFFTRTLDWRKKAIFGVRYMLSYLKLNVKCPR